MLWYAVNISSNKYVSSPGVMSHFAEQPGSKITATENEYSSNCSWFRYFFLILRIEKRIWHFLISDKWNFKMHHACIGCDFNINTVFSLTLTYTKKYFFATRVRLPSNGTIYCGRTKFGRVTFQKVHFKFPAVLQSRNASFCNITYVPRWCIAGY